MLRVLGRKTSSNVQKVMWYLDELHLECIREDYGGDFGGNRDADFLRLNPNGTVPTLIDDGVVVWESNTILRYLANKHGATRTYPSAPAARAHCEKWMDWQLSSLNAAMTPLYIALVRTPAERRNAADVKLHRDCAYQSFSTLDAALKDSEFVAADHLTLADICLGMFAYRWFTLPLEHGPALANLDRWYERLQQRAGFRRHIMIGLS